MKKLFLIFCCFAFFPSLYAKLRGDGDFQFWQMAFFTKQITSKTALRFEEQTRLGANATEFYFAYVQGLYKYRAFKWFLLSAGYRQMWLKLMNLNKWQNIYSPIAEFDLIYVYKRFGILDRSRFQYLIIENELNRFLYRNRFQINYDFSWGNPFIEDELFFLESRGFSQNRFSVGTHIKATSHVYTEVFYTYRLVKGQKWLRQNIINLYLFFHF